MKKIEVIIKSEKLEDMKRALNEVGVTGMSITNIMGYGNHKGYTRMYRGKAYVTNIMPRIKVETVVCDEIYEDAIKAIMTSVNTNSVGDGKIFVYDLYEAIRIRTGGKGNDAI